jgi:hypothetical protein
MTEVRRRAAAGSNPGRRAAVDVHRRMLCGVPVAAGAAAFAAPARAAESGGTVRMALLLGNRIYPPPHDLPPVHKNIRDLREALEQRGFQVTSAIDLAPDALRAAIREFGKAVAGVPPDATILFYFTGHGMQVDAENLMLGSGIAPDARENVLLGASLHLRTDVLDLLPRRETGMTIAVIDACRSSLRATLAASDGLNQVEAPLGCMVVFSTGAGKPAIAPAVETANTFYTGSLVKLLKTASDELSFSDLFRLVKLDVQQTMLNHPLAVIRQVAQFPFIAENTKVRFRLTPRAPAEAPAPPVPATDAAEERALWVELEDSMWPADVVRLAEDYLRRYPQSKVVGSAQVAREGGADGVAALKRNDVRLYRAAFQPKLAAASPWLAEWRKAARGDKDAAARIGRAHQRGDGEIAADNNRYEGWMQYAAALGNGIASYELAVHYRRQGQPQPAAQFEARSKELGYTPPPTLDNVRK